MADNQLALKSDFDKIKSSFAGFRSKASHLAAKRMGKTGRLECEEKAVALRQNAIHINVVVKKMQTNGYSPESLIKNAPPAEKSRYEEMSQQELEQEGLRQMRMDMGICQLLFQAGTLDGLSLLSDMVSLRQPCVTRPYMGACPKCEQEMEASPDATGVWCCKTCQTCIEGKLRKAPKSKRKSAHIRITLAEMAANAEALISGSDGDPKLGIEDEPGLQQMFMKLIVMMNDLGVRTGAWVPGTHLPVEEETSLQPEADQVIKFACGNCKMSLQISKKFAGQVVECSQCKAKVEVPEVVEVRDQGSRNFDDMLEVDQDDAVIDDEVESK